jgi:hypothetical protein
MRVIDVGKSQNSKLVEIFLVIYGTILLFDGIYNQPSELFIYLGLINQFIILLIAISFLAISFTLLSVHKKDGDKALYIIVFLASAGLHIIGKNLISTIIGVILFLVSIFIYLMSKKTVPNEH